MYITMTISKIIPFVALSLNILPSLALYGTGTHNSNSQNPGHQQQWTGVGQPRTTERYNYETTRRDIHGTNEHDQYGQVEQGHGPERDHQESAGYGQAQERREPNQFAQQEYSEKYGYPEGCVRSPRFKHECDYYVDISKRPNSNSIHFELSGKISDPNKGGFVAVGLSEDKRMGDDDIVECVRSSNGVINVFHSWVHSGRKSRRPERLQDDGNIIKIEEGFDYDTHSLTCKFEREPVTYVRVNRTARPIEIDLIHNRYHILMAIGGTEASGNDRLAYHGDNPVGSGTAYVSHGKLGWSNEERGTGADSGGNILQHFVTVNAALMIICWIKCGILQM